MLRARPAALSQEPGLVATALELLEEVLLRDPAHARVEAAARLIEFPEHGAPDFGAQVTWAMRCLLCFTHHMLLAGSAARPQAVRAELAALAQCFVPQP